MTQIVWDGRFLVADRKCFRGVTVFPSQKLRIKQEQDKSIAFAFAGSYEECNIADKIMLAEESDDLIESAKSILTDPATNWQGICVDTKRGQSPAVSVCNYLGMREPLPTEQFFAVGACSDEIIFAYNTWRAIAKKLDVPAHALFITENAVIGDEILTSKQQAQALVNFLRTVLKGTYYDQEGYLFDVYDSITGEVLCL